MKPLKACAKCGGEPIKPPSKVLCAECLAALNEKFKSLGRALGESAARSQGEGESDA